MTIDYPLDQEEIEINNAFVAGKLKRAPEADIFVQKANKTEYFIPVSIDPSDMKLLHQRADLQGIPYQQLLSGLVHRYLHEKHLH